MQRRDADPIRTPPANILFIEANMDGTIGGSYVMLFLLAKGLDRSMYNPIVVFQTENALIPRFVEAGIRTHVLHARRRLTTSKRHLKPIFLITNILASRFETLHFSFRNWRYIRLWAINMVHLNNSAQSSNAWKWAAMLAGIPCIAHERTFSKSYSVTARLLGRYLTAVLCVSNAVRANLIGMGLNELPLVTVYDGLDPDSFKSTRPRTSIRSELGIRPTAPVIGMVGNIKYWKGQDVVIHAMRILKLKNENVVCVFLGDVSSRNSDDVKFYSELQELVRAFDLDGDVIFSGYQDDVASHMNAFDIVVHASRDPEPFGIVLLEAMAMCKPVVAARAGGPCEIVVDGQTGFLYEPGNSEELAEKLALLLSSSDLRRDVGDAGYSRLITHFSMKRNISDTEGIYRSALFKFGRSKRRRPRIRN